MEHFGELEQALEAGADIIMLDDFDLEGRGTAVALVNGRAKLEASGGEGNDPAGDRAIRGGLHFNWGID